MTTDENHQSSSHAYRKQVTVKRNREEGTLDYIMTTFHMYLCILQIILSKISNATTFIPLHYRNIRKSLPRFHPIDIYIG